MLLWYLLVILQSQNLKNLANLTNPENFATSPCYVQACAESVLKPHPRHCPAILASCFHLLDQPPWNKIIFRLFETKLCFWNSASILSCLFCLYLLAFPDCKKRRKGSIVLWGYYLLVNIVILESDGTYSGLMFVHVLLSAKVALASSTIFV